MAQQRWRQTEIPLSIIAGSICALLAKPLGVPTAVLPVLGFAAGVLVACAVEWAARRSAD